MDNHDKQSFYDDESSNRNDRGMASKRFCSERETYGANVNWNSKKGNSKDWINNDTNQWYSKKPSLGSCDFEEVPSPGKGRKYTISIAIPASILEETCLKDDLRTYVVGQIARAANIYSIDEVIVYDDSCWKKQDSSRSRNNSQELIDMMRILLEYQECPQYLRRHLFSFHKNLSRVGVLNALNSPHHLRSNQWCMYREGFVLDKCNRSDSFVDVGLGTPVSICQKLKPGLRVTVKLPPETQEMRAPYGIVVSPDEPREKEGFYWGYAVRVANSLTEVLTVCRFKNGYDLIIGTSDKGDNVQKIDFTPFTHALIVFGGVEGLEAAVEADDSLEASEPKQLFDFYVNTCPLQQARTVRTEEAVLISLCTLQDKLLSKGSM